MNLATLLAPLFIVWLVAMLYVVPSYFRRLGQLIDRLENHHNSEFERLGQPSLKIQKLKIGGTLVVDWFVLRKDYLRLSNAETTRLGNSARSRPLFMTAGPLILFVLLMVAPSQS